MMTMRILNILFFTLIWTFVAKAQNDTDVLMTVGDDAVTVSEFKYIYEKNNGESADYTKKTIDEYLDLYKRFKLKVQKAKDMQLDTMPALKQELAGYQKQLSNSYLEDKEVSEKLLRELYDRKQLDVEVRHILMQLPKGASTDKEKQVVKKLENVRQQLREGKSFSTLAREYSEDRNSKNKGGSLGYVTAMLPRGFYELENTIYTLGENEVSEPVKSRMGYHLVKVMNKRPARGKMKVAHIFLKATPEEGMKVKQQKDKIENIYNMLQGGKSWDELVTTYSEDKTSKDNEGALPPFGIGTYEDTFEDIAFNLKKDGDYSKPFQSKVGFHIIKRLEKVAPETFEDLKTRMKDKIRRSDRYEVAKNKMLADIKQSSNYTVNKSTLNSFLAGLDQRFFSYKWQPEVKNTDAVLFTMGDKKYSIGDFANYARSNTRMRSRYKDEKQIPEAVDQLLQLYSDEKAFAYEEANLTNKYPAFKNLMREYSEGILLFEATKINVWDKANADTVGLYNYYEANKGKYMFPKRVRIGKYVVNSNDEKVLEKVKKCAKKRSAEKTLKRFNKDGTELVTYTEFVAEPNSPELLGLEFKKGSISPVQVDNNSRQSAFKKVVEILPAKRKTFSESRGYVVSDYQEQLERQWVNDLKKEYPIKVNQSVYNALIK